MKLFAFDVGRMGEFATYAWVCSMCMLVLIKSTVFLHVLKRFPGEPTSDPSSTLSMPATVGPAAHNMCTHTNRAIQAATGSSVAGGRDPFGSDAGCSCPAEGDGYTYEQYSNRGEMWLDFIAGACGICVA